VLHMAGTAGGLPGPPWFRHPTTPFIPPFHYDDGGQQVNLPYIQYALLDGEPMVLGTTGLDAPIYGEKLFALAAPPPPFQMDTDNSQLNKLFLDHPFNWAINLALFRMNDPGVLADVHCLRESYTRLKALKHENDHLNHMLDIIQKEKQDHVAEIQQFVSNMEAVKERLTAAHVRT
jgi:hypothetical protein